MAKSTAECFLCGEEGKGRRVTFYSGVRKGGSRTELLCATVIVAERWRDLKVYEIHVCRDCQQELWAARPNRQPLQFGAAAAAPLVLAGLCTLLLPPGTALAVGGLLVVTALGLGGAAVWSHLRHKSQKPDRAKLEWLIVGEAMTHLPDEGHTFITSDQYTELVRHGVIG